jgi:hypothetical protein
MRRLAVTSLVTSVGAALALLAAVVAQGCGPSQLSKDYAAYDARAEKIIEREMAAWQRLLALLNEQTQSAEPPPADRFRQAAKDAVPFYEAIQRDVAAAAPAQADLAAPHETLVKFADRRAAFARRVAEGVELLGHGDPWRDLDAKDAKLQAAKVDYVERVQDRLESADQRFFVLQNASRDFQRLCVEPLGEGRLTAAQMSEIVRTRIQPKIREARASKFEDDEESRSLRAAVIAADEYFDAAQQASPVMEAQTRLMHDILSLTKESDELYMKFRDEMKAVRGRM